MRIEWEDPSKKKEDPIVFNPPKDEKRTLKTELVKMRGLGWRRGGSYFWEYYHMPLIIIIAVIAMLTSITVSFIRGSRPYVISVAIYNNALADNADVGALEEEFTETQGMNLKDYQIIFNFQEYFQPGSVDETSYTTLMKLTAQLSGSDIDILGGNLAFMNYFGSTEKGQVFFANLEDILPAQFLLYLQEQNRLLTLNYYDEDGNKTGSYIAGVDISNTRIVNSDVMVISPCYAGIAVTSKRADTAVNFLKWLFSYQD